MEILILIIEIVFKFVALAALIIGAFVIALVSYAYYVCSKDETERMADKND